MGHDQLFKEFLKAFFRDFLKLFYPDVARRLNWETLRFLDKELFTDIPEGSLREADVVAEVQTREGAPELLLVHVEVQAKQERDFPERMFQYYALLWLRYQMPVFPIVVYLRGGGEGLTEGEYLVTLFEREQLRFRYASVGLARLDAGEYLEMGEPVGAALAALMNRRRSGDPLTLRAWMLQRIAQSGFDEARKFLLLNLIETYFELGAEEMKRFRHLLSKEGYREAQEMEVTWADKIRQQGKLEGKAEGKAEGRVEAKRETLLRLLTRKFGALPQETTSRVRALESVEELDAYLDRVLTAKSLGEMGLGA